MIVSLSGDLKNLGSALKVHGFEIHYVSEGIKSDAYIYSSKSCSLMNLSESIASSNESLIINADNKSTDEILFALNHRVYSSLF